jgi:Ca-activated chloride channel family protein
MNTSNNSRDSREQILPADPRITAYAFGELEGDELKVIEAAVNADPALQAAVAELRGFGGQLATALGDEPAGAQQGEAKPVVEKRRGLMIPFPLHYLATAAAACFAVVVWVNMDKPGLGTNFKDTPPVAETAAQIAAPQAVVAPVLNDKSVSFDSSLAAGAGVLESDTMAGVARQQEKMRRNPQVVAAKPAAGVSLGSAYTGDASFAPAPVAMMKAGSVENEAYALPEENRARAVSFEPLSTFSIDVDTASYSNVRRFLMSGRLPPRDAVRVEELINYFPYRYAPPKGDVPFAAKLEVASAPWAPEHRLVRIGLKGREVSMAERRPANLVFLIDVSGSMNSANKLPLVKESLRLLVERLRPDDRVAIVTYAGSSGLALPSTPASKKNEILASLDNLQSGGSTNGAMGIHLAYDIAKANFVADGGINRVILCTDGDFNVGVTDRAELVRLVEEKAKSRVFLSVFGFGMGNLKDFTLEALSGKGNGAYGYIDSRREAEKVFVEQVEGTLVTIAKDVKIQVEFNPAKVASYRLIGYENRMLAKEDFNNDAVDAGDIGAGHTVTALYEVVPVGAGAGVDPLKYQKAGEIVRKPALSEELLTVKIRYKAPEGEVSRKQEFPLVDGGIGFAKADGEFRFAAAVAAWGMLLRDSPHKGSATFEQVIAWAGDGLGDDTGGHRAEFVQLVRRSAEVE